MADLIRMEPEELRARAGQLRGYVTEHQEIIRKLTNLIINLDDVWSGDAQTAYVNRFRSARSFFENFDNTISALAETMETSANKLQEADRSLRSLIERLD